MRLIDISSDMGTKSLIEIFQYLDMEALKSLMRSGAVMSCHGGIFRPGFKKFGLDSHAEPQVLCLGLMALDGFLFCQFVVSAF